MKKNIYKTVLLIVIAVFYSQNCYNQALLSDLKVHNIGINDSIVNMVMIDFNCQNVEQIAKFELLFDEGMNSVKNEFPVIQKGTSYFVVLLNKEEILIKNSIVGFVTPLPRLGVKPYFSISINGLQKNGVATNSLTYKR